MTWGHVSASQNDLERPPICIAVYQPSTKASFYTQGGRSPCSSYSYASYDMAARLHCALVGEAEVKSLRPAICSASKIFRLFLQR